MTLKMTEVSNVQALGRSGDERTDTGCGFPVEGEAVGRKRFSPPSSSCLCLKRNQRLEDGSKPLDKFTVL